MRMRRGWRGGDVGGGGGGGKEKRQTVRQFISTRNLFSYNELVFKKAVLQTINGKSITITSIIILNMSVRSFFGARG